VKAQKFIPLVVVAAGLLAWHNSFTGPFIFDDVTSIQENSTIRRLWPISQPLSPPRKGGTTVEGRPLTNLSLAINYALGGFKVQGYHVLNLAVHILAGLALLGVVRRTLLQPKLRGRFGTAANELALAVALLWTVHPLQTESVTYIIQRAESIMGLFYLLTLYCFIRGAASPLPRRWYILCVAACALGMASKEVIISAPFMVLLYDRTFVSGSFREAWHRRRPLYLALASTWILLGFLVVTYGNRGGAAGFTSSTTSWQAYALTQLPAIAHYLRLSFWPTPLVFDYGTAVVTSAAEVVPGAVIVAILLIGTLIALNRSPSVGFLGVWFFAILAPTSSVMPVVTQTIAEHRMYLSLAAVVTLSVIGIYTLLGRHSLPFFLVLAAGLGFLTTHRNEVYRSDLSIWTDTVAKRPENARAQYNLGNALTEAGRPAEAIPHSEQALRIDPWYLDVHNNLGLALFGAGRVSEAIDQYKQTLQIKPNDAKAYVNLANALLSVGKAPEAIECFEQALRIKPDNPKAHYNLGLALWRAGRVPEAIQQYELTLQDNPDFAEAHNNLGIALSQTGRIQEAISHFEQALRIKPDYTDAHMNLAGILIRTGKTRDAIAHYEQVVRLKPDFIELQNNLAWLLATLAPSDGGDAAQAVTLAERACQITRNQAPAYLDTLAAAYASAGRFNDAVATAQKAIDLATAALQSRVANDIRPRLELYRNGQAYRQAAAATPTTP